MCETVFLINCMSFLFRQILLSFIAFFVHFTKYLWTLIPSFIFNIVNLKSLVFLKRLALLKWKAVTIHLLKISFFFWSFLCYFSNASYCLLDFLALVILLSKCITLSILNFSISCNLLWRYCLYAFETLLLCSNDTIALVIKFEQWKSLAF